MLLGIDLGTTGIKAVVLRSDGSVAASAGMEYDSLYPKPGWVEQDPQTWVKVTGQVVRSLWLSNPVLAGQIRAIGFSGQMHGMVAVDSSGKYLRPAIIWADGRSQAQVDRIATSSVGEETAFITGNPVFPGFMLPSLLWVRENEPEVWQKIYRVLLPKDYLRFVFTGEYAAEPSAASSTGLMDIRLREWSSILLEPLEIPADWLPPVMESVQQAGSLTREAADLLGLSTGLPVVCGGSDQACQALGNGVITPGDISCTIGTGGQIFAPISTPQPDPKLRLHLFCHVLPTLWHLEAATLSAGLSLRWLRDLSGQRDYKPMADAATEVEPGSEGLFFGPFLQGERTPYMDAQVRGGFVGLSIRHGLAHLTRAVMEGVMFSLRSGLELITERTGRPPAQIIASGGAVRHPLWLELLADISGLPVVTSQTPEPAAVGAAMLAGIGTETFSGFEDAVKCVVKTSQAVQPRSEITARYRELYRTYQMLYEQLKPFSANRL